MAVASPSSLTVRSYSSLSPVWSIKRVSQSQLRMMSVRSTKIDSVSVSTTSVLTNLQNNSGLAVDGGSSLKMILSYVNSLPTGNEEGLIPKQLMSGTSEELFNFIASGLSKFIEKESERFSFPSGKKREIGFTFSFPVKQTSIDSGILIKWTKGFAVSGTRGKDVVACLNEAMERQRLDMRVSALVNDSVGTLAGARYWDDNVMVAVILGTGTDACYVERMDAISKLSQGDQLPISGSTIINTEWGAFSKGLPLTEFDKDMDNASINPGEQIFEKTISGMYLGEIVRRVLVKMAELGDLFGDSIPEKLSTPLVLRTPDLCAMQQDNSCDLIAVGSILSNKFEVQTNLSTRKTVVEVIDTIVKRGGRLAGAGIVGILQKMEQDSKGLIFGKRTMVAMDGGLYENYPQYREYLQDAVLSYLVQTSPKM
ncbi:hypothetical protein MKX01_007543 [Papaver californicum]|nr:hypothetical protein MKX01_007543 [Papaver californicum]